MDQLLEFFHGLNDAKASLPSRDQLERIISVAFWSSLEKEEARPVTFSLLFATQSETDLRSPMRFETPLVLSVHNVVKLAPAVLPQHRALIVSPAEGGDLNIYGTAALPSPSLSVEACENGHLRFRLGDRIRAVFQRGRLTYLAHDNSDNLLHLVNAVSEYGLEPSAKFLVISQALEMVVEAMMRQGHGGTILWVPDQRDWSQGIKSLRFRCDPPFTELARSVDSICQEAEPGLASQGLGLRTSPARQELLVKLRAIQDRIDGVGRLTAVDGAVVINESLVVFAFGVMLRSQSSDAEVMVSVLDLGGRRQPEPGDLTFREVPLAQMGGARHRSAAEFCASHRECLAFVASQDGSLTVFGWRHRSQRLFAIVAAQTALL
jgi:hypothetical protein